MAQNDALTEGSGPAQPHGLSLGGWFGKTTTNLSSGVNKWLGRNRPVTGAGAVAHVGAIVGPTPNPARIPGGQWQQPNMIGANSINPHGAQPNTVITSSVLTGSQHHDGSEFHAPANKTFYGVNTTPKI
jgi:hypothetical protein